MYRSMWLATIGAGLAGAVLAAPPVQAAERTAGQAVMTEASSQSMQRRRPARIVVQPRSYLDAGTEVLPGERKFNDYALPPNYSPTAAIDGTGANPGGRIPGPFDLWSKRNPMRF